MSTAKRIPETSRPGSQRRGGESLEGERERDGGANTLALSLDAINESVWLVYLVRGWGVYDCSKPLAEALRLHVM